MKANAAILNAFHVPVHVPSAPNDAGLSVGAIWAVTPPPAGQELAFLGFPAWDAAEVERVALGLGAVDLRAAVGGDGVVVVAELLAAGAIVGVVRGRQEFG